MHRVAVYLQNFTEAGRVRAGIADAPLYEGPVIVPNCFDTRKTTTDIRETFEAAKFAGLKLVEGMFEMRPNDEPRVLSYTDVFVQTVVCAAALFPQSELEAVRPWASALWVLLQSADEEKNGKMLLEILAPDPGMNLLQYLHGKAKELALKIMTAEIPPPGDAARRDWDAALDSLSCATVVALESHQMFAEMGWTWPRMAEELKKFGSAEWRLTR